jgi:ubiquinone/menaquinone biosynthesis C-methylase UbiE
VLDYGCGNGTMLLRCAVLNNDCRCLGIDISQQAVELAAKDTSINNLYERASFECGGTEKLSDISTDSFDSAMLSNIIDNVFPEDTDSILRHIHRILKPNGKLLLKLNAYVPQEQLSERGLTELSQDFYLENDGLYLRNLKNEQWEELFFNLFQIHEYREIYFKEFDQTNRLYLLTNKK